MEITDNDLKMFQERARTELTGCGTGGIAWDSVIWDLCHEVRRLRSAAKENGDYAKLRGVAGDLLYMAERYLKRTPATETVIFDPETKKEVRTINYYAVVEKARSILSGDERPGGDGAKLREALDELVANLEMRASAFDVFSIVDRKVFLDAKAALAATAAELGSAAKAGDAKAARDGTEATDKKPAAFKIGDRVSWTDPDTGEKTDGWTVLDAPEIPDGGPSGDEVYTIADDVGLSEVEAHARELSYPEGRPL